MAKINNPELIRGLINKAKINLAVDQVPSQLAEKIVPMLNVTPEYKVFIADGRASDATSFTIYTASTKKRTFVCGGGLSLSKDAVNNSVSSDITLTPKGRKPNEFITIRYEPLTAGSNMFYIPSLLHPIELQKGSTITVNNNAALASIDCHGTIYLFELDDEE